MITPNVRMGRWGSLLSATILACLSGWGGVWAVAADGPVGPVPVCVSTPDLEGLVREVGGARVEVMSFSAGPEDPHEIELKPGLAVALDRAELYVQVGLGLENAWLERLMRRVKNASVKPGGSGNLNAGVGVAALEGGEGAPVPGSFHEDGNPHYLLDPLEGLRVAAAIRDRLMALRPAWASEFRERHDAFRQRIAVALVGEKCAREDNLEALVREFAVLGSVAEAEVFRARHGLEGWLGRLVPHRGRNVVGDHDLWPYFARRCGIEVLVYLEPSPGVPPSTRHLRRVVTEMQREGVGLILSAPYFEARHTRFVAERTGARILPMAHQTAGRPGTETYEAMLRHNFEQLLGGLSGGADVGGASR